MTEISRRKFLGGVAAVAALPVVGVELAEVVTAEWTQIHDGGDIVAFCEKDFSLATWFYQDRYGVTHSMLSGGWKEVEA